MTDRELALNAFKALAIKKGYTEREAEALANRILQMKEDGYYTEAFHVYIKPLMS